MTGHRRAPSLCIALLAVLSGAACITQRPRTYPAPTSLAANDFVIVPGARMGAVILGMTEGQLLHVAGPATRTTRFGDGVTLYDFGKLAVQVYVEGDHVYRVETSSKTSDAGGGRAYNASTGTRWDGTTGYSTESGIQIGSTRADLIAKLGEPKWTKLVRQEVFNQTFVTEVICYPDNTEYRVGVGTTVFNGTISMIGIGSCIAG